ncbi:hypothetical protein AVEN_209827-1 [Araneus ventricosus]|uniref:Uncharacterized protein n=1 Tax=Araneus ventricosus TaxID=182803 RepID=A0A4Y2G244_ARAVE|nr:hypothetical protein AVEN_209827-1 [Araneus ventricosus]
MRSVDRKDKALGRRSFVESCKHDLNADKKFGIETDISVRALRMTVEDTSSESEIQKAQLEDPDIRPILEKKLKFLLIDFSMRIVADGR